MELSISQLCVRKWKSNSFNLWVSNSKWNLMFYKQLERRISIQIFELVTRKVKWFWITQFCNSWVQKLQKTEFEVRFFIWQWIRFTLAYKRDHSIIFIKSTIMLILFWDFLMVQQIFFSPLVKWRMINSNKLVYTSCFTSCQKI